MVACRCNRMGFRVCGRSTRLLSCRRMQGFFRGDAARQLEYRIPCLTGSDAALNPLFGAAMVDRDAVATVPGPSVEEIAEYMRPDGVTATGPQV